MSEHAKPLLVVKIPQMLSKEASQKADQEIELIAQRLGMHHLVVAGGSDAHIETDMRPLLTELIAEQRKTNLLLASLIEAMADENEMVERPLRTYLNGEPIL